MSNDKGFTLIELMVVLVILGILVAIALPNFTSMQNRAKESEVTENVHTVHLVVEDYKVMHTGTKPSTASISVPAALKNPFTLAAGASAITTEALAALPGLNTAGLPKGQLGYTDALGGVTSNPYIITGSGRYDTYIVVLSEGQ